MPYSLSVFLAKSQKVKRGQSIAATGVFGLSRHTDMHILIRLT